MEVEALLCLTEAVIRTHKQKKKREKEVVQQKRWLIMLFQSSASKAKSDIDRYYGTCMGNNFLLKNQL